jgi:serine/threonine protein kinase
MENLVETDLVLAFERFKTFSDRFGNLRSEMIQLQGRLAALRQQAAGQLIHGSDVTLETNQIRHSFLYSLDQFKALLPDFLDTSQSLAITRGVSDQKVLVMETMGQRLRQHYALKQFISDGNSSMVILLEDIFTGRNAVAKVFKLPNLTQEIKDEIQLISRLKHRNIIKILGESLDVFPFYVITEYVNGAILNDAIEKTGPRPQSQVVDWMTALSSALEYLRVKQIGHSNVRPSKIFIDEEQEPMISPFDIIKFGAAENTMGRFRENCLYLSPEQLDLDGEIAEENKNDLHLSDQFSLGAVGYKIVTGTDLFQGKSIQDIMDSRKRFFTHAGFRKEKLDLIRMPAFREMIGRMLQADKYARFPDFHELKVALRNLNNAPDDGSNPLRESYRRCMGSNREFIRSFYDRFIPTLPEAIQQHFKNREKQYTMLQMAIDVLIDLDHREAYLLKLIDPKSIHAGYDAALFAQFIKTLIETARVTDKKWDASVEAEWRKMEAKAMGIIGSVKGSDKQPR